MSPYHSKVLFVTLCSSMWYKLLSTLINTNSNYFWPTCTIHACTLIVCHIACLHFIECDDLRSCGVMNSKQQVDPFVPETIEYMLQSLPVSTTPIYRASSSCPRMTVGHVITLNGNFNCTVLRKLATGGFASVFNVSLDDEKKKVLKVHVYMYLVTCTCTCSVMYSLVSCTCIYDPLIWPIVYLHSQSTRVFQITGYTSFLLYRFKILPIFGKPL